VCERAAAREKSQEADHANLDGKGKSASRQEREQARKDTGASRHGKTRDQPWQRWASRPPCL